jgi:hypothetical protein
MTSSVALTEWYHHKNIEQQQQQQSNAKGNDTEIDKDKVYDRNVLATLPDEHEIWDHVAYHIASLCTHLFLSVSVERIVLGGGIIMGRQHTTTMLHKIHTIIHQQLNGYILPLQTLESIQSRVQVSQYFGDDAGLFGAIYLAQKAYWEKRRHVMSSHHENNQSDKNESTTTTTTTATSSITVTQQQQSIKQIAFRHGIWHGMIIGMIGTALFYKYCTTGSTSHGRRMR